MYFPSEQGGGTGCVNSRSCIFQNGKGTFVWSVAANMGVFTWVTLWQDKENTQYKDFRAYISKLSWSGQEIYGRMH